ncbi:MAG: dockerin type I domain-containing protein, partial [Candidatus Stygibacter australis]|nr:dockerin type I domain-containing protein [Candidatus Stygibacter australis]
AGYNIYSIHLTHGNRKIVLEFTESLPADITGAILLNGIEDFNSNQISEDGNLAELTEYIKPHLVGTMNDWTPSNHDYDLQCNNNMLWSVNMLLAAGTYEYKVTESNAWDGGDWPSDNQVFTLAETDEVTIWVNCGLMPGSNDWDGYVCQSVNPPIVCGNFLSEMGGTDWDETTDLTVMNDNGENGDDYAGDGIFSRALDLEAGDWELKIVLNNNWQQNTSDGNLQLSLTEAQTLVFTYNFVDNQVGWHSGGTFGFGDIDNNGLVESYDAAIALQYFVGIDPVAAPLPWEDWRQLRADVDGNGYIEAYDASLIQRFVVGIIDHFPVEE